MKDQIRDQLHLHGVDPLQGKKLYVRKRDARIEEFNEARICLAIESAFKAVEGIGSDDNLVDSLLVAVKKCADVVVERVLSRAVRGEQMEVERIQDAVEDQLMLHGHLAAARCYILYREKRRLARAEREGRAMHPAAIAYSLKGVMPAVKPAGELARFCSRSYSCSHSQSCFCSQTYSCSGSNRDRGARDVSTIAATRSLLKKIYNQAFQKTPRDEELEAVHRRHFSDYINEGQFLNQLSPELLGFDLETLAGVLRLERDGLFPLTGLQALHDDYLLHDGGRRIETPQYFWMRVAMGLALNEGEQCNVRAMEFYEALSTFRFVPSETVLCHSGTMQPQLITCCAATRMERSGDAVTPRKSATAWSNAKRRA